jgi:hypothetical protein
MLNWTNGKKTYITAAVTFIVGGLMAAGITIPPWLLVMLGSSGLGFLRLGVSKRTREETR